MNRREYSIDVLLAWWMLAGAVTGRIDEAIEQNARYLCFRCPERQRQATPSADEGWLIASGWFGFDLTLKRGAGRQTADALP